MVRPQPKYKKGDRVYVDGRAGIVIYNSWVESEASDYYVDIHDYCNEKDLSINELPDSFVLPSPSYSFGDYWGYQIRLFNTPKIKSNGKAAKIDGFYDEESLN